MDQDEVLGQFRRVFNQLLFLRKKRVFTYQGVSLFPSEVHLMLVIRDRIATNATRIAEEMGVTKAAVSQGLSRLEEKGVILKSKDPARKNELTLTFTPFGGEALQHYRDAIRETFDGPKALLEGLSLAERQAVSRFRQAVEEALDRLPN